jgi:hypothetical protein
MASPAAALAVHETENVPVRRHWLLAATAAAVLEVGAQVNAVDQEGSMAMHNGAARGDVDMILYLVSKGADRKAVNREGKTTADMANGPVQRIQPLHDDDTLNAAAFKALICGRHAEQVGGLKARAGSSRMTRTIVNLSVVAVLTGLLACSQQPGSRGKVPDGWPEAAAAAYREIDASNPTAAVGVFEKYAASDPDFYPAHKGLGDAHAALADKAPSSERSRHLESAATAYRRGFEIELASKPQHPPSVGKLLGVLDRENLNRPAEQEAITREVLTHYPADSITHLQLVDSLLKGGKFDAIDGAVRAATLAVQDPKGWTLELAGVLNLHVLNDSMAGPGNRRLSPADARTILTSSIAAVDEALKTAPDSADLLQQKSGTLLVLARIEQDPRRVEAIRKDAADLQRKAEALKAGSR